MGPSSTSRPCRAERTPPGHRLDAPPAVQVSMTTAKAFRQKGTGRARAGALSDAEPLPAAVWRSVRRRAATPSRSTARRRKKALRAALVECMPGAARSPSAIREAPARFTPSTKAAAAALADFRRPGRRAHGRSATTPTRSCAKSFRNIKRRGRSPRPTTWAWPTSSARRAFRSPTPLASARSRYTSLRLVAS